MCVGGCMAGGMGQVRVSYHSKGLKQDSCFDYVSAACFVNGSCHGVSHVQAKGHDGVLLEWVAVIRSDGGWELQLACAIPMPSQTQPHTLLLLQAVASLTFDVHLSTAPLSLFIWIISDTFAMRFCFCPGPLLYQGLKPASRKCSPVHITLRSFYWATSSFVKSYGRRKIQQVCRFHNREENRFIILLLSKKIGLSFVPWKTESKARCRGPKKSHPEASPGGECFIFPRGSFLSLLWCSQELLGILILVPVSTPVWFSECVPWASCATSWRSTHQF